MNRTWRTSEWLIPISFILIGTALRLHAAIRLCPSYDEVFVMAVGLIEAGESWTNLLFHTPLARSNAVTPLWWWWSALATGWFSQISLEWMRIPGLTAGILSLIVIPLSFRRWPRNAWMLILGFVAFSDIMIFTNARAEFSESLLLPCSFVLVSTVARRDRRALIFESIAISLLMMTHFGKGITIAGIYTIAQLFAIACTRPFTVAKIARTILPFLAGTAVTIGWLLIANTVAYGNGPIRTDIGTSPNVWTSLRQLTLDYTTTKSFVIAKPLDALEVFLDRLVWPVQSLLAWPIFVGAALATRRAWKRNPELTIHHQRSRILSIWATIGACVVIAQGICGARFHLIYLPALWALAAIGLPLPAMWNRKKLGFFALGWLIWIIVANGWTNWQTRNWSSTQNLSIAAALITTSAAVTWLFATQRYKTSATLLAAMCAISIAAGTSRTGGPLWWGQFARFEPMNQLQTESASALKKIDRYRSGTDQSPAPESASLQTRLAHFFLTTGQLEQAERYAKSAVARNPDQTITWYYLAIVSKELDKPDQQRAALDELLKRDPNSQKANEMLKEWNTANR